MGQARRRGTYEERVAKARTKAGKTNGVITRCTIVNEATTYAQTTKPQTTQSRKMPLLLGMVALMGMMSNTRGRL